MDGNEPHDAMENLLGLPENGLILVDTHSPQLLTSIILIQNIIGMFPQFLHMSSNKHLTKLDEITMRFIVDLDYSPGVGSASNLTTSGGGDEGIRAYYCEWDFGLHVGWGRDGHVPLRKTVNNKDPR